MNLLEWTAGESMIPAMPTEKFMTVDEVMARLGFKNPQNVYDAIKRGQLRGFRDDRRMWWISEESVNNYQKPRRGRPSKK